MKTAVFEFVLLLAACPTTEHHWKEPSPVPPIESSNCFGRKRLLRPSSVPAGCSARGAPLPPGHPSRPSGANQPERSRRQLGRCGWVQGSNGGRGSTAAPDRSRPAGNGLGAGSRLRHTYRERGKRQAASPPSCLLPAARLTRGCLACSASSLPPAAADVAGRRRERRGQPARELLSGKSSAISCFIAAFETGCGRLTDGSAPEGVSERKEKQHKEGGSCGRCGSEGAALGLRLPCPGQVAARQGKLAGAARSGGRRRARGECRAAGHGKLTLREASIREPVGGRARLPRRDGTAEAVERRLPPSRGGNCRRSLPLRAAGPLGRCQPPVRLVTAGRVFPWP